LFASGASASGYESAGSFQSGASASGYESAGSFQSGASASGYESAEFSGMDDTAGDYDISMMFEPAGAKSDGQKKPVKRVRKEVKRISAVDIIGIDNVLTEMNSETPLNAEMIEKLKNLMNKSFTSPGMANKGSQADKIKYLKDSNRFKRLKMIVNRLLKCTTIKNGAKLTSGAAAQLKSLMAPKSLSENVQDAFGAYMKLHMKTSAMRRTRTKQTDADKAKNKATKTDAKIKCSKNLVRAIKDFVATDIGRSAKIMAVLKACRDDNILWTGVPDYRKNENTDKIGTISLTLQNIHKLLYEGEYHEADILINEIKAENAAEAKKAKKSKKSKNVKPYTLYRKVFTIFVDLMREKLEKQNTMWMESMGFIHQKTAVNSTDMKDLKSRERMIKFLEYEKRFPTKKKICVKQINGLKLLSTLVTMIDNDKLSKEARKSQELVMLAIMTNHGISDHKDRAILYKVITGEGEWVDLQKEVKKSSPFVIKVIRKKKAGGARKKAGGAKKVVEVKKNTRYEDRMRIVDKYFKVFLELSVNENAVIPENVSNAVTYKYDNDHTFDDIYDIMVDKAVKGLRFSTSEKATGHMTHIGVMLAALMTGINRIFNDYAHTDGMIIFVYPKLTIVHQKALRAAHNITGTYISGYADYINDQIKYINNFSDDQWETLDKLASKSKEYLIDLLIDTRNAIHLANNINDAKGHYIKPVARKNLKFDIHAKNATIQAVHQHIQKLKNKLHGVTDKALIKTMMRSIVDKEAEVYSLKADQTEMKYSLIRFTKANFKRFNEATKFLMFLEILIIRAVPNVEYNVLVGNRKRIDNYAYLYSRDEDAWVIDVITDMKNYDTHGPTHKSDDDKQIVEFVRANDRFDKFVSSKTKIILKSINNETWKTRRTNLIQDINTRINSLDNLYDKMIDGDNNPQLLVYRDKLTNYRKETIALRYVDGDSSSDDGDDVSKVVLLTPEQIKAIGNDEDDDQTFEDQMGQFYAKIYKLEDPYGDEQTHKEHEKLINEYNDIMDHRSKELKKMRDAETDKDIKDAIRHRITYLKEYGA